MLDPDNPTLADTLSMQGQIYQGLGKLPEAERSLREAVAIYRKAFNGPHYLIGIAEVYLGLIQSQRGDTARRWPPWTTPSTTTTSATARSIRTTATCWSTGPRCWRKAGPHGRGAKDCAAGMAS